MRRSRAVPVALLLALSLVAAACSGDDTASTTTTVDPQTDTVPTTVADTTADATSTVPAALDPDEEPTSRYRATIRRDSDGVPHIVADDLASAFFGQGYASGQDYSCTLTDQLLKVQSRRAAAYGRGDDDRHVTSDFAWAAIGIDALARADYESASDLVRDQFDAFAAGWSRHLDDVGADGLAGWCQGGDYVAPITGADLYAYARSVALNASGARLAAYVASAQPPTTLDIAPDGTDGNVDVATGEPPVPSEPVGSNGWAVGRDLTTSGEGGMLVANPHFPWEGELRFWESHLTVPGELDIYGVQLTGLPGIGIGFTDEFAWTHTVSAGHRFTAYTLTLAPGDPTSYLVDGEARPMTSQDITVQIREDDGSLIDETRTLWASEYGPVIDFPGLGWSDALVATYRDANIDNDEFVEQYAHINAAQSLDEFIEANRAHQGGVLFNTIAVGRDGRVWYADTSATPKLSDEAEVLLLDRFENDFFTQTARGAGAILLDGSDSRFVWEEVPGARDPGLVPWDELPMVERTDMVFNANDSFWVNNLDEVLDGEYSVLHGPQGTARSTRTRMNLSILSRGPFTGEQLRNAAVSNESFTAEQWLDGVVDRCDMVPSIDIDGEVVDLLDACAILSGWSGTFDLDQPGAPLWREWLSAVPAGVSSPLWAVPFDPADPLGTPSGLAPAPATGDDPVLVGLAEAVRVLASIGATPDATLRDLQFAARSADRIPIHGGTGQDGVTNVVSWGGLGSSTETVPTRDEPAPLGSSPLRVDGYPISYGTSFIMTVDFSEGETQAWALLLYSNGEDRSSPLFDAQMRRYSEKDWRTLRLTDEVIEADAGLTITEVTGD